MHLNNTWYWATLFLIWLPCLAICQDSKSIRVQLVSDYSQKTDSFYLDFGQSIIDEVEALLGVEYTFDFQISYADFELEALQTDLDRAYADESVDIVIAVGTFASNLMAQRTSFPKPSVASIILDTKLQNVPITPTGTSGVANFAYVVSPIDTEVSLDALYQLTNYDRIGVFGDARVLATLPFLQTQLEAYFQSIGAESEFVPYNSTAEATLADLDTTLEAALLLPEFGEPAPEEMARLFSALNEMRIPSLTLFGEPYLALGATVGYAASDNLQRIPRRIATDLYKILDGQNASELPVVFETSNQKLLINMASARQVGAFPSFDFMADAQLLNIAELPSERTLSLEAAVAEALQANLDIKIAQVDPAIARTQAQAAGADLLPQVNGSSNFIRINDAQAQSSFGAQGLYNWSVAGTLSQVIVSEPAFANQAIQKLLQRSAELGFKATQLDVILEVSEAFLQVLQAKAALNIQNQNLEVTRENLNIALAKEQLGYSGQSDVLRLQSELAQRNIDLYEARATFNNARYRVNQLLNRPVDEVFEAEDIVDNQLRLQLIDERLDAAINNFQRLEVVADFLVEEALRNLPELQQVDVNIAAQDRQVRLRSRARYLPSVALSGQYNYLLGRYDVPQVTGLPPELLENFSGDANRTQWNLALGLQYPIFQGNKRNIQLEQARLERIQLESQRKNLENILSLQVRSAVQIVAVASARLELSRESADAARENFELVQDLYSEGGVNITPLLDAQNASVQAELSANNALYQFVIDVLGLERSIGNYYTFDAAAEREAFFQRLITQLLDSEQD